MHFNLYCFDLTVFGDVNLSLNPREPVQYVFWVGVGGHVLTFLEGFEVK